MGWTPTLVDHRQTGYFSKIILDYLDRNELLTPFYAHPVSEEGIRASIAARKQFPVNREVLVDVLREQYNNATPAPLVSQHIEALLKENTYTIVTAHQPALFTGPLYFIYKILHTIRLAKQLSEKYPDKQFVPVFYMGSEDADLDELGHFHLGGEKIVWDTKQTGAVGRMKIKGLDKILHRIEGELSVLPFGKELVQLVKSAYLESPTIQEATFRFLHSLFASYGLVILIPDHAALKRLMIPVFEDDLFRQIPTDVVNGTIERLSQHYKVQANPRPINLFYLKDALRGRIEKTGGQYKVHESDLVFDEEEIRKELHAHPDRFSPNVILRGLFQETILPNIAFIGGGGETAYWLELKDLFTHYGRPFPLLILRNSFLLSDSSWKEKRDRLGISPAQLFLPEEELLKQLVRKESSLQLDLVKELAEGQRYYDRIRTVAGSIDPTLAQHVTALEVKALDPLKELEKKLLKAEKRKFGDQQRQIHLLKAALFPSGSLQERIDNFMPWYAARGQEFIEDIYAYSLTLEQQFVVLEEEGL